MIKLINRLLESTGKTVIFLAEGVSHNNVESLAFIKEFAKLLSKSKKICIYMEGPKITSDATIKNQLIAIASGFNSTSYIDFYNSLLDKIKFVDIDIWEMFPYTSCFSDALMTQYQMKKDEIVYNRISRYMDESDVDIHIVYFGISHSYRTWYDKDWDVQYKRLKYFFDRDKRNIIYTRLISLAKINQEYLAKIKLPTYNITKIKTNITDGVTDIVLPSTSIDVPLYIITKTLSKKMIFRYPKFFSYVMNKNMILSERKVLKFINTFKTKVKHIGRDKEKLLFELRLYFSLGTIYSMNRIIDGFTFYSFIKYIITQSKYLFILLNYVIFVFLTRIDMSKLPEVSIDEIEQLKKIIYNNDKHILRVTTDDKKIKELFFTFLLCREEVKLIPKINDNYWPYKNPFEWLINK